MSLFFACCFLYMLQGPWYLYVLATLLWVGHIIVAYGD